MIIDEVIKKPENWVRYLQETFPGEVDLKIPDRSRGHRFITQYFSKLQSGITEIEILAEEINKNNKDFFGIKTKKVIEETAKVFGYFAQFTPYHVKPTARFRAVSLRKLSKL